MAHQSTQQSPYFHAMAHLKNVYPVSPHTYLNCVRNTYPPAAASSWYHFLRHSHSSAVECLLIAVKTSESNFVGSKKLPKRDPNNTFFLVARCRGQDQSSKRNTQNNKEKSVNKICSAEDFELWALFGTLHGLDCFSDTF